MSYCLNPNCQKASSNPSRTQFCQNCGDKLLLKERYRAIKLIGTGGFGRTFLAVDEDKPSKPRCAIKQFYPQAQGTNNSQKAAELFALEAVRLDELGKHPQIPELLAYFTQDEQQYLVQEYIDGQNLAHALTAEGAFSEAQIRCLLSSLLPVLDFIHSHDVIHRDIKPENIIRRQDGHLVLVDFGAAKFVTGTALARTATVIGSAGYVAPEQAMGKAVFASDLYSLGVTCIHLLSQVHPFDLFDLGENGWVWQQYLVNNPVSDELSSVLDRLIENATNRRYQSASEVLKALNRQILNVKANPPFKSQPTSKTIASNFSPTPKSQTQDWKCIQTLMEHSSSIRSVAFSPDGHILASCGLDNTINLWETSTGKLITQYGAGGDKDSKSAMSVAFSSDGKTLASGSSDHTIKLREASTGKLIRTIMGHSNGVRSIAFSPDGTLLASGSADKTIKLWQTSTGKIIYTFKGHSNGVHSVAFSPDGTLLASSSADTTIKLWQTGSGKLIRTITGHSNIVRSIAFSPNGKLLASGSFDRTIKLWLADSGNLIHTLDGHSDWISPITFSPNGKLLTSGSADATIKLWQTSTAKLICTITGHSNCVNSVAFSPNGKLLASGSADATIKLWQCN